MSDEAQAKMNSLGFGNIDGNFKMVDTADVFDQLQGDYGNTGFSAEDTDELDELGIAKLKKVSFRQYVFF